MCDGVCIFSSISVLGKRQMIFILVTTSVMATRPGSWNVELIFITVNTVAMTTTLDCHAHVSYKCSVHVCVCVCVCVCV